MKGRIAIIGILMAVSSASARTQEPFGLGVIVGEPAGLMQDASLLDTAELKTQNV